MTNDKTGAIIATELQDDSIKLILEEKKMKIRKILASLAAAAVACTAMAISASAVITNATDTANADARYAIDFAVDGYTFADVYGIKVTFAGDDLTGYYGAIITQDDGNSWNTKLEFGDDKDVQIGEGVFTIYDAATPLFADGTSYGRVIVADWGAPNETEVTVEFLDVDGNPIEAAADEPTDEPADEPADEPTDEPADEPAEDEPTDDNPTTGAAAGLALASVALAGAAVVATKKTK